MMPKRNGKLGYRKNSFGVAIYLTFCTFSNYEFYSIFEIYNNEITTIMNGIKRTIKFHTPISKVTI